MVLCIYICSHIVLCRYVLYGIVLVLDDFILCKCLQFGFMFVNSQLIQYGCTYMALYFVVLRHCIALGPVLPGTPGDWPTSHKRMYCFAVKPWSFIWLCISHTQSYWNAVLVFNVHLIYGQESGYQASSFENLTSLYDPTVPHSSTQFHTVPHSPVMRTLAKDRNLYRGFVAGCYILVHTNCIRVFTVGQPIVGHPLTDEGRHYWVTPSSTFFKSISPQQGQKFLATNLNRSFLQDKYTDW